MNFLKLLLLTLATSSFAHFNIQNLKYDEQLSFKQNKQITEEAAREVYASEQVFLCKKLKDRNELELVMGFINDLSFLNPVIEENKKLIICDKFENLSSKDSKDLSNGRIEVRIMSEIFEGLLQE